MREPRGSGARCGTVAAALCGRACGFDSLRLGLAFAILAFHSVTITQGSAAAIPAPVLAAARLILPMFFAMSGFLVAASLKRSGSLLEFAALRLLRLVPGLLTVVLLTALVLGPVLAEIDPLHYFASPGVAVAMWTVQPSCARRARVPAQRTSASSGWASRERAVGMGANA